MEGPVSKGNRRIYTHDEAARIVELFEDILDKYDIKIPSPEDDERGADNDAKLYGSVYSDLLDDVENCIINLLHKYELGAEIIKYIFSGSNTEEHRISACTKDGIWLVGAVDDYYFEAKVCDTASGFGIDNGRVIKLFASKGRGQEIFAFERGWDKYPESAHEGLCQALVRFCESLPMQDIWKNTFRKERHFLVIENSVLEYENDNT